MQANSKFLRLGNRIVATRRATKQGLLHRRYIVEFWTILVVLLRNAANQDVQLFMTFWYFLMLLTVFMRCVLYCIRCNQFQTILLKIFKLLLS